MTRYFKQTINARQSGVGMTSDDNEQVATCYLQRWYHPVVIDDNYILDTTALTTVVAGQDIITFEHQPDYPRNVTVIASAAATSEVIVYGVDVFGDAVHEHLSLTGTTGVTGTQIFSSITSIHLAAQVEGAANVKVGVSNSLGLLHVPILFLSEGTVDAVREATVPVLSAAYNSVTFNTALSASKVYLCKYWSSELD